MLETHKESNEEQVDDYSHAETRRKNCLPTDTTSTDELRERKTQIYYEQTLFPNLTAQFPSTRYQGSKAKLVEWIWEQIADLDFTTCLDAFGGTGCVAYRLKQAGKQITYNDILRFNYYIGLALIENSRVRLNSEEVDWLLRRHSEVTYPCFVQNNFRDIYFTDEENVWIDQTITNICQLTDPYKFALAFFALCQACIIKRPYNLFHRKNLYLRFAEVERSFGNKTTWDRPFDEWFRIFAGEANLAIFDNGQMNRALNLDAVDVPGEYDLVYIDTPYISKRGVAVDYLGFYHFLEGLTMYDEWGTHIDRRSKHRRLQPQSSEWTDRKRIHAAFDRLFQRYRESIVIVSYRSDGIPSEPELVSLLKKYKRDVRVEHFGQYKYVLSTNSESKEMLLIGT
jgi:adenine-specific DNA-methyltransferase